MGLWLTIALLGCASGQVREARWAMDHGDYEGAARLFRQAAQENPEDADLWGELGRAEIRADRPHRAREAFEQVALLRPQSAGPRILIGMTWEMQRRYEEALLAYGHAIEVAPEHARGHRVLGTRLLRWGEPEGAVEPLRRAVELDPTHAETMNALGMALYQTDQLPEAEEAFRRGVTEHPEHQGLYLGLAALLINAGRHSEALSVYDEVVDRWDEFAPAHVGRAILLHELERTEEALEAFERARDVARDPRPYAARLREYRALIGQPR